MPQYTPEARTVVRAIQSAKESQTDYVSLHMALLAVLKLPPTDSVMARALSDDRVWGSGMRQQVLRYASGDPGYRYVLSGSVGFRPSDLVEKAETFAKAERAAFISERHLALALQERGAQSFGQLGVNGQVLVGRVTELEGTVAESLCFVLMPFRNDLTDVYSKGIKPVAEAAGLRCERADEIATPGVILEQIDERIRRAQVVVADLTGANPNVTQELGYARALQKPIVLLAQETRGLPFDVQHFRVLQYSPDRFGIRALRDEFSRVLIETLR